MNCARTQRLGLAVVVVGDLAPERDASSTVACQRAEPAVLRLVVAVRHVL